MYKLNLLTESEIGELGIMKAFMYVYVIINDKWSTHCLQGFELENLYKKAEPEPLSQNLNLRIYILSVWPDPARVDCIGQGLLLISFCNNKYFCNKCANTND